MIAIDGSEGEGGGQVLRSALGLSLVSGRAFAIERIRQRRKKPGLQRQHLTAVLAAAQVGAARVEGAELGSERLEFHPGSVQGGYYRFAIGTAGSTTLVLQTVLPALWAAATPSVVELHGGTHNPMAPPFDFLARTFAPVVARMGGPLALELERPGFHPAGGGIVRAHVAPAAWRPIAIERSATDPVVRGRIVNCAIPAHVAAREADHLQKRLGLRRDQVRIDELESAGPGNAVMIEVEGDSVTELVIALAERSITSEAVAERAVRAAKQLLGERVPVGQHLADQLLIPMALAGGGTFVTMDPSEHTRTNARIVEMFLPVAIELRPDDGAFRITIAARPA